MAKNPGNEDALKKIKGYSELLRYSNVKHIIGKGSLDVENGFAEVGNTIDADDQIESKQVVSTVSTSKNSGSTIKPSESQDKSQNKPYAMTTGDDIIPSSLDLFSLSDEAAGYADLAALKETALKCTRCVLANGRTHVVFGEGAPDAMLMFIGEGPGEQEDLKARPFVGRAGQLLDKMIAAMGYKREEVYIANIVKCRPPQNRAPLPEEAVSCLPYLRAQISFIKPKIIVLLGAVAVKFLLQTNAGISQVRGKFLDYHGYKVMPTFHPAFLLRSPGKKKEAWEDLKKVITFLKEP